MLMLDAVLVPPVSSPGDQQACDLNCTGFLSWETLYNYRQPL